MNYLTIKSIFGMKTFHIGIIGYGGFGKFLHHWWNKLDNIKVIAVSDLHDISENIEACKFYQSWIDLTPDAFSSKLLRRFSRSDEFWADPLWNEPDDLQIGSRICSILIGNVILRN